VKHSVHLLNSLLYLHLNYYVMFISSSLKLGNFNTAEKDEKGFCVFFRSQDTPNTLANVGVNPKGKDSVSTGMICLCLLNPLVQKL
jgi:hypothetical protein